MGNQLGGDSQNAEITNNAFQQMVNNPEVYQRPMDGPNNSQNLSNINNGQSIRRQQSLNNQQSQVPQPFHRYNSLSPVKQPFNSLNSTVAPNFNSINYGASRTVNPNPNMNVQIPQRREPQRREPKQQRPFSFFQQIFGGTDEQSSQIRSNSASNVSMTNNGRKISILQSNLQLSERKVSQLERSFKQSQQKLNQAESRFGQFQSKIQESEHNVARFQQRIQFLEQQANMGHQQIQKLRNLLGQKQKYLAESQVQIRTQRNQIQLQNNRINQFTIRQQRKDKQILSLSSEKFELNSLKIRLQNNIKILQEQIQTKSEKISQLDKIIIKKNRQIQNTRHQKSQLQKNIFNLQSQIQKSNNKYEQQKNTLNSTIRDHLQTIDYKQARILQLNHKIDKYHHNQLENQAQIGNLQSSLSQNEGVLSRLQKEKQTLKLDIGAFKQVVDDLNKALQQQRIDSVKNKQIADKALNDFNNAKKVGQKQIQFLQTKVQELLRIKQRLNQEIQITKAVAIQRTKIFQRSIIYDLKHENDKLWAKLIQKSNNEADFSTQDIAFKKSKVQIKKSQVRPKQPEQKKQMSRSKSQLQVRFENFIKKLSQNGQTGQTTITRDFSSNSLQKHNQNTQFYRQKCNQLQKMVESHLMLNRNLKDQLQRSENNEIKLRKYQNQIQQLKKLRMILTNQNEKLKQQIELFKPEAQIKQRRLQNKVKQMQSQNKRLVQDITRLKKEIQVGRSQGKINLDQVKRQQNQINVYKKWQSLYDDLKNKYDNLSLNLKQDYKGMYQQLLVQHKRLRQLYDHREEDFEKLKRINNQKLQNYEKEQKQRQNNIQQMKRDYQQLEKHFNLGRQEYQNLLINTRELQNQLHKVRRQGQQVPSKEKVFKLIQMFKARIVQIGSYIKQIKNCFQNEQTHNQFPEWVSRCQKVLEVCLIQCDKIRESH